MSTFISIPQRLAYLLAASSEKSKQWISKRNSAAICKAVALLLL